MHILIVNNTRIPAHRYGGTERVIWWLGKELVKMGYRVSFLVGQGSYCDFADVIAYDPSKNLNAQIPADVDLVHMNILTEEELSKPSITTVHGNVAFGVHLPLNSVFVSRNHAERHGSNSYVYNGLDFSDYGGPGLNNQRLHYHFLGKAAWRVKNVRGAIDIINKCKDKLVVIGGDRINLKMGIRITPYLNIKFKGIIGGEEKHEVLRHSKGLVFPVLWHEPFGVAIPESLYFGCPVFGTPYGSLPELVPKHVGVLSASKAVLTEAITNNTFDRKACHDYAVSNFSSTLMAARYSQLYEMVASGQALNIAPPTLTEPPKGKFLALD